MRLGGRSPAGSKAFDGPLLGWPSGSALRTTLSLAKNAGRLCNQPITQRPVTLLQALIESVVGLVYAHLQLREAHLSRLLESINPMLVLVLPPTLLRQIERCS